MVVDIVVLKLKLFKSSTAAHEIADHETALRSDTVFREI